MWGPSRAKKGLDLCPEQGKDLSPSPLSDLSRSFPIPDPCFFGDRSRGFLLSLRYVTLHRLEGSSKGIVKNRLK